MTVNKNLCLFIDTNGKIRACEVPEKPNYEEIKNKIGFHAVKYAEREYEAAVQAALDNGVECEDQEWAWVTLDHHHWNRSSPKEFEPMKPYPIPDYKMEVRLQVRHGVEWHDLPGQKEGRETDGIYRKLATLTLISNV